MGTVGEPINPEAWMWYKDVIGKDKCPIVDTWWQTETGGVMISPLPGVLLQSQVQLLSSARNQVEIVIKMEIRLRRTRVAF